MTEPDDLERVIEEAREGILDFGHVTLYSTDPNPTYQDLPRAWTTGRTLWDRPEFMVVGPFLETTMQQIVNDAVYLDMQTPLEHGSLVELAGRQFMAQEVETAMFLIALHMFNEVNGLQLVWADPRTGEFPGEPQVLFPPGHIQ